MKLTKKDFEYLINRTSDDIDKKREMYRMLVCDLSKKETDGEMAYLCDLNSRLRKAREVIKCK